MSLANRLYLVVAVLVLSTLALAFVVTGRGVLAPFSDQVFEAYLDQALFVAEQIEQGARPDRAGRRMGLEVVLVDRPGPPPLGPHGRRDELLRLERDGRDLFYRAGPRNRVVVRTDRGWVVVSRDLDLGKPRTNLTWVLLLAGVLAGVAGTLLARMSLRPVRFATEAMQRVADGDLDHRVPDDGPAELRQVARAFHQMTARLKALLQADRQLVAGVSHEIRTPLSRLRLRVELLRDELGAHPRLDAMEQDLAELDGLVGELVELSRLQLGGYELNLETAALGQLVQRALDTTELGTERVAVTGKGAEVRVDIDLAVRALSNVFSNVQRYAPEGPVQVQLDGAEVRVVDAGPGVPADVLDTLFEPFVRVETSRARKTGGLGLGLMIVKQVLELHGGTVSARNVEPHGLEVRLVWPVSP